MRICSVMEGRLAAFRCEKGIAARLDGKYPAESLTGNRKRARVKMPREPHVNGHGVKKRGLSNERACVLCGVNELGDCFCRLVGRGKATVDEVRAGIAGVDLRGAVAGTDKPDSYCRAADY